MTACRDEWPVTEGEFPTGTELILWRPGIDRSRLRLRVLRAAVFSSPATYALLGVTLVAMGAAPRQVSGIFVAGAAMIAAGYALVVWVNYRCADYDHQHRPNKQCFLDRTPGEYFYRRGDFLDLPPAVVEVASTITAVVRDVHTSPAVAWLGPQHLHEVHQVAWDALRVLDQTRTLRALVDDPHYQVISNDLRDAQARLTVVDDTVGSIVSHLHQVTFLVQAWEQKLVEVELRSRLRAQVVTVPDAAAASTLRRAESLTECVFAYITAARDVTHAGAFAWERP